MAIEFSKEKQDRLIPSIQRYFAEELDEEIGDLKAMLILDFVAKEIGPTIYNQAIRDAQSRLQESVADLDGTCFEPEFRFWKE